MKKLKCVLSIPGDTMYLRAQTAAAKAAADRLGVELDVLSADMDPVNQGQQLLNLIQSRTAPKLDAILLEPVSAAGLPRVAETAVAAGIAWVVSNAQVDYIEALRRNAKAPVFLISQDHVEIGRIQGRQIGAMFQQGGSVLYLRGPGMSSIASRRLEGLESGKPKNIEVKALKVQGATAEDAYNSVCSWLGLSVVRPDSLRLIASQNADFIFGARKAFESNAPAADRAKWLALPGAGAGTPAQVKPLVDQGILRAAVLTSLTMDKALDMLMHALKSGVQPRDHTYVEAQSYPGFEELSKKPKEARVQ